MYLPSMIMRRSECDRMTLLVRRNIRRDGVFETSSTDPMKYVLLCHFMKSLPLESPIDLSGIAIRGEKGDRAGNECRSTDELRLRVHR